jgi:hypothetical protein
MKKVFEVLKNKNLDIIIIILILAIMFWGFYQYNYSEIDCDSFDCFKEQMEGCSKASYVNDEPEASWKYLIEGREDDNCKVKVKLLLAKKGELGIENLIGNEMSCLYPLGVGTYPEKDLRVCHGRLKEELQQIIINKLHSYIIENLGQIDQELNRI